MGSPGAGARTYFPLIVDGSASGSSLPGVRQLTLTDVVVFGGEIGSSRITCTQGFTWNGGGTSQAGGKSGQIFLIGNATTKCAYTQISVGPILGGVNCQYAQGGTIVAGEFVGGSISFDANSERVTTIGSRNSCTISNSSATSGHIDPGQYGEGVFTPVVTGATSAGVGTYVAQVGRYTRVGRMVNFIIYLSWTAHTGTGNMKVEGLPSTAASGVFPPVTVAASGMTFSNALAGYVNAGGATISIFNQASAASLSPIQVETDTLVNGLFISGTYYT